MPKRKRDSDEEESAEESGASSVSDRKPKKKATKASTSKGKAKAPDSSPAQEKEINGVKYRVTSEGESYVELGTKSRRRITIREFKGATLLDIREFYEDKASGERRPGKKGIVLSVEEWRDLMNASEAINALIEGP
ncbi:hypothetical protein FRC17_009760 [Serendipita sp. 399]|nr:hypothetical protein FRC17_009760 [Serendipita sp. 399]